LVTDRAPEPEPRPHRLFVAVSIPDRVADLVQEAVEPWRRTLPKVRWAPRENWHVTLRFLGSTDQRLVPWVGERLSEVARSIAPFGQCVRGLGAYPSTRRARVLWAGLGDHDGTLAVLAQAVSDALDPRFPSDERAFSAHVTLARSEPPIRLPGTFAATPLESERFVVDSIELVRSRLRRPAPVYERVATFPLSGS
jgi:2'-5' RNA ligase